MTPAGQSVYYINGNTWLCRKEEDQVKCHPMRNPWDDSRQPPGLEVPAYLEQPSRAQPRILRPTSSTAGQRLELKNVIGQDHVDFYIPIFGILEFIFFNGWLRVAGALLNPFGNDDDDFDLNYIIDRNITLGYIIADQDDVEMEPDTFGEDGLPPIELPHTERSVRDGAFAKKSYKKRLSKADANEGSVMDIHNRSFDPDE